MLQVEHYAEQAMEDFWSHREAGDFDAALLVLRGLGHCTEAVEFSLNPDSYYFPNRRGDRFVRPQGVSEDQIPVLALEHGRQYHYRKPVLHPLQRTALQGAGLTYHDLRSIDTAFNSQDDRLATCGSDSASASVYQRLAHTNSKPAKIIESKPSLIFNVDPSDPDNAKVCPSVPLHEIVHIVQTLSHPVYEANGRLQKELEAYAVQGQLISNYRLEYSYNIAAAAGVEHFRIQHLGPSNFVPDAQFIREFQQAPHLKKVWQSVSN